MESAENNTFGVERGSQSDEQDGQYEEYGANEIACHGRLLQRSEIEPWIRTVQPMVPLGVALALAFRDKDRHMGGDQGRRNPRPCGPTRDP